jgi:hypothetical protein
MAEPPLAVGAVNAILTLVALAVVAAPIVGAPGNTLGVTLLLELLAALLPAELIAVTVNVYAVPAVNPVTVIGLVVPVFERPPGELVAL